MGLESRLEVLACDEQGESLIPLEEQVVTELS
jgi:hypothetical protein